MGASSGERGHSDRGLALAVLAAVFLLHLVGRGVGDSYGVFILPLEREFGWSRSQITGVYSLYLVVYGVAGPVVGYLFDRWGPRAVYSFGLTSLGLSYILAAGFGSVWQFHMALGLFAGIGVASVGMVPASGLVSRWYRGRLGTAIAVAFSGFAAGMLVMVPFAQYLVEAYGWRMAYRTLGGILLGLLALTLLLPWKTFAAGRADIAATRKERTERGGDINLLQALRMRSFWAMAQVLFFTGMMMFTVLVQVVAYLIETGFPPLRAASAYGIAGSLSVVGIIGAGWMGDRLGYRTTVTTSFILTVSGIVCLLLLSLYPSYALLTGFVILFGLSQGARGPIISALSARLFAGRGQAAIYGAVTACMGVGAAIGSWASGVLHDWSGNYQASFVFACLCAGFGVAPFWTVPALSNGSSAGSHL